MRQLKLPISCNKHQVGGADERKTCGQNVLQPVIGLWTTGSLTRNPCFPLCYQIIEAFHYHMKEACKSLGVEQN